MAIITLTTDYGMRDPYVAAVKGVLFGLAPEANLVDVTHEIEAHHILAGAFVLSQVAPWFPVGTVHLVVVDPGVGSSRRIIVCRFAGQYVVAPDNGLITLLHRAHPIEAAYVVENRSYFLARVSHTFHGRDIMAPIAAHLANGVAPQEFGRTTDRLEMLELPKGPTVQQGEVSGHVLYVDQFGTLVTNIAAEHLALPHQLRGGWEVFVDDVSVGPLRSAYADVPVGAPLAIVGGTGMLEVAVNCGRAVDRFDSGDVTITARA